MTRKAQKNDEARQVRDFLDMLAPALVLSGEQPGPNEVRAPRLRDRSDRGIVITQIGAS